MERSEINRIIREGRVRPMHLHRHKTEDINNCGGGELVMILHRADPHDEGGLSSAPVQLQMDRVRRSVPAGEELILAPGESSAISPYVYHSFWARKGSGAVMIGEVSTVNDDATDNRFYEPLGRLPPIVEDEPPYRRLCTDCGQAPMVAH